MNGADKLTLEVPFKLLLVRPNLEASTGTSWPIELLSSYRTESKLAGPILFISARSC